MGRDLSAVHDVDHRRRDEDVRAAALHFVRMVTGSARPTGTDRVAYERAVASVTEATCCLLDELETHECEEHAPAPVEGGTPTARSAGCRRLQAV